jgi:alpha-D-ribose 1-methylphosphonate 5-triphosphate synthase subunit PhnG
VTEGLPVTRAEIWTTEFPGMFVWSGIVNYYVLADSGGSPTGPPLYGGTGGSVTREADPLADCCGYDEFKYSFEFDPPLNLQTGTRYWLAINIPGGGGTIGPQAFWASASARFGNDARATGDPTFASWATYSFDLAFRLLNDTEDTTAPTLITPSGVIADATSPAGTSVTYTVTATDDLDPSPTLTCTPLSGGAFPIGDTTVACTTTDAAGNVATASFSVHVKGAQEQVADLTAVVDSYNLRLLGTALHDKLVKVQEFLAANKPKRACEKLDSFLAQVKEQRGKRISVEQADRLTLDARRIKAVIGC